MTAGPGTEERVVAVDGVRLVRGGVLEFYCSLMEGARDAHVLEARKPKYASVISCDCWFCETELRVGKRAYVMQQMHKAHACTLRNPPRRFDI